MRQNDRQKVEYEGAVSGMMGASLSKLYRYASTAFAKRMVSRWLI